jgi:hypothetical protein
VKKEIEEQPQEQRLGRLKNGGVPCDITKLPRCQAKAKSTGQRCRQIAMKGKRVCFIHGGKSPGAKTGNKNALKTGLHTAKATAERHYFRQLIKSAKDLISGI